MSTVECSSEDRCIWLCPLLYTGEARYVDGGPVGAAFCVTIWAMEGRPLSWLEAKLLVCRSLPRRCCDDCVSGEVDGGDGDAGSKEWPFGLPEVVVVDGPVDARPRFLTSRL